MFYAGFLVILAMQSVIVWRVLQTGERLAEAINLLGDIEMKQEDFDVKVKEIEGKITEIDSSLETESGEINENLTALRDEIVRLQGLQGDDIDTSALDAIGKRLESSAQRISGLVDPLPGETPPIAEPAQPADPVDPVEELPATPDETSAEASVTEEPTEKAGE